MRDSPTAAISLALLLTAAIIGGAYYLLVMRHPEPIPPSPSPKAPTTWQTITPRPGHEGTVASDAPRVPAETSRGRTNTPIKCFDPEVGEFWTNATTCERASTDLSTQLADPAPQVTVSGTATNSSALKANASADNKTESTKADRDKYMGKDYLTPEEEAVKSRSDDNN